jgi:hypothetical protein
LGGLGGRGGLWGLRGYFAVETALASLVSASFPAEGVSVAVDAPTSLTASFTPGTSLCFLSTTAVKSFIAWATYTDAGRLFTIKWFRLWTECPNSASFFNRFIELCQFNGVVFANIIYFSATI